MNISGLKAKATERLSDQGYPHRRLALIYAGLIFVALMAATGINYYVNHKMNDAVGLSGMGMLSVLETVQVVLGYAVNILAPFWQMGFVFAALQIARGVQARPAFLKEGFRRIRSVLGLMILRTLIYGGLLVACVYISVMIYAASPLAQPLMDMMMPLVESGYDVEQLQQMLLELPIPQLMETISPVFWILIPVGLALLLPMYYRFRMADLIVMDKAGIRALPALMLSGAMTRKKRMALFKLDLSFWWFYALQLVGAMLCYLNFFPVGEGLALGGYVAGQALQVLVFWYAGGLYHTTWAVAYEELLQPAKQE